MGFLFSGVGFFAFPLHKWGQVLFLSQTWSNEKSNGPMRNTCDFATWQKKRKAQIERKEMVQCQKKENAPDKLQREGFNNLQEIFGLPLVK